MKQLEIPFAKAKKMLLIKDGMVHTFYNLPMGIIGARWNLNEVLEEMKKAWKIMPTGPEAMKYNHGLAVVPYENCLQREVLFVETKHAVKKK